MQTGFTEFTRTRLAPTPSGYLHLGNIYSFALTAAIAQLTNARILLRIDDLDTGRSRDAFIGDIFTTLRLLDIPWNEGPVDPQDLAAHHSQIYRTRLYDGALARLRELGAVFACTCSRAQLSATGSAGYPGTCRNRGISLDEPDVCWRVKTPAAVAAGMHTFSGPKDLRLPAGMRDFIVRKKDGEAAYQLSSLVDDEHYEVDLVVRGEDLAGSSIAQLFLAKLLDYRRFGKTVFLHHPLLTGPGGDKLSKSAGDTSIQFLSKQGKTASDIYAMLGEITGIRPLRHWRDLCGPLGDLLHAGKNDN